MAQKLLIIDQFCQQPSTHKSSKITWNGKGNLGALFPSYQQEPSCPHSKKMRNWSCKSQRVWLLLSNTKQQVSTEKRLIVVLMSLMCIAVNTIMHYFREIKY